MGLHESVCKSIKRKKLNERAETNIKKIDFIELNEFLAGLKELIEYDINPDLEYFKVVLDVDSNKAYIDVESKNMDEWELDGWSVDDILSINNPDEYEEFVINVDSFNNLKKEMLDEKSRIINKIIPKLARQWGFRNVNKLNNSIVNEAAEVDDDWDLDRIDVLWEKGRESIIEDVWGYGISDGWTVNRFFITEDGKPLFDYQPSKQARAAVDKLIKSGKLVHKVHESCNEEVEDKEPILMQDMIDYNLFKEGKNYFVINHNDKVKYIDDSGKIVVKNHYDIGQCEFDFDGMYQMYFISLIDKEDISLVQKVADVLGFDVKFVEGQKRRLKDGYNYLCVMYIPISVLEMPVPEYLVKNNISPDLFKDKARVVSRINMATKKMNKKK